MRRAKVTTTKFNRYLNLFFGALALIAFQGCRRIDERQLVGAWRSEKDGAVDEIMLNSDHTLVSWMCPAELSTPPSFLWRGEWHVRGNRIEIDSRLLTSPAPPEHYSLQILKFSDALVVENTKEHSVTTFTKFDLPTCGPRYGKRTNNLDESSIVGTWQVHFHTHDLEYRFAADHAVKVLGKISGEFQPLWNGSWRISGSELAMELKPATRGMGEEKVRWTLYDSRRDCFSIKDPEGVTYTVHRAQQ